MSNEYIVKSIKTTYGLVDSTGTIDSLSLDSLSNQTDILFSDIVMVVRVDEKEIASASAPLLFNNAAYADPAPPKSKNKLSYIKLTSEKPLYTSDRVYEAGEDLEAVFGFTSVANAEFKSIYSHLGSMTNTWDQYGLVTYISFVGELTQPVDQTFTVTYEFSGGAEVQTTTAHIMAK